MSESNTQPKRTRLLTSSLAFCVGSFCSVDSKHTAFAIDVASLTNTNKKPNFTIITADSVSFDRIDVEVLCVFRPPLDVFVKRYQHTRNVRLAASGSPTKQFLIQGLCTPAIFTAKNDMPLPCRQPVIHRLFLYFFVLADSSTGLVEMNSGKRTCYTCKQQSTC